MYTNYIVIVYTYKILLIIIVYIGKRLWIMIIMFIYIIYNIFYISM